MTAVSSLPCNPSRILSTCSTPSLHLHNHPPLEQNAVGKSQSATLFAERGDLGQLGQLRPVSLGNPSGFFCTPSLRVHTIPCRENKIKDRHRSLQSFSHLLHHIPSLRIKHPFAANSCIDGNVRNNSCNPSNIFSTLLTCYIEFG